MSDDLPAGVVDLGALRFRLVEMAVAEGHPLDLCVEFARDAESYVTGGPGVEPAKRSAEDQSIIDGLLLALSKVGPVTVAMTRPAAAPVPEPKEDEGGPMMAQRRKPRRPNYKAEDEPRIVEIMNKALGDGLTQKEGADLAGINSSRACYICQKYAIRFPHVSARVRMGLKQRGGFVASAKTGENVVSIAERRPGDVSGRLPQVLTRRCQTCPSLFQTDLIDDIFCPACVLRRGTP